MGQTWDRTRRGTRRADLADRAGRLLHVLTVGVALPCLVLLLGLMLADENTDLSTWLTVHVGKTLPIGLIIELAVGDAVLLAVLIVAGGLHWDRARGAHRVTRRAGRATSRITPRGGAMIRPTRRAHGLWLILLFIAVGAATVGGVTLLSHVASSASPHPNAATTAPATTTTAPTTTTASNPVSSVDQAIAADGSPWAYDPSLPDAYSAVYAECQAWTATGQTAATLPRLLASRMAAGTLPAGELAALRIGVPVACPGYAGAFGGAR